VVVRCPADDGDRVATKCAGGLVWVVSCAKVWCRLFGVGGELCQGLAQVVWCGW